MKTNLTKLMSVALLFAASLMATGCSKDDDGSSTTESTYILTADDLIEIFIEAEVLTEDGILADDAEVFYLSVSEDEDEDDIIEFLEFVVGGTFDTSGEKVTLSDGTSYVDIIKSSTEGIYYNVIFSLNELDAFEMIIVTEEYLNSENKMGNEANRKWADLMLKFYIRDGLI